MIQSFCLIHIYALNLCFKIYTSPFSLNLNTGLFLWRKYYGTVQVQIFSLWRTVPTFRGFTIVFKPLCRAMTFIRGKKKRVEMSRILTKPTLFFQYTIFLTPVPAPSLTPPRKTLLARASLSHTVSSRQTLFRSPGCRPQ